LLFATSKRTFYTFTTLYAVRYSRDRPQVLQTEREGSIDLPEYQTHRLGISIPIIQIAF